ncbi:MAG: hypothetical protein IJ806_12325 [Ruminococcus sp.]|nr:hypothetical protein [Ruminococcus sp.]
MNRKILAALLAVYAALNMTACTGSGDKQRKPGSSQAASGAQDKHEGNGSSEDGSELSESGSTVEEVSTDAVRFTYDKEKWSLNADAENGIFQLEHDKAADGDKGIYMPIIAAYNPDAASVDLKTLAEGMKSGFENAEFYEEKATTFNGCDAYVLKGRSGGEESPGKMELYIVHEGDNVLTTGFVASPPELSEQFMEDIREVLDTICFTRPEEDSAADDTAAETEE